jgi:hypothetical protein
VGFTWLGMVWILNLSILVGTVFPVWCTQILLIVPGYFLEFMLLILATEGIFFGLFCLTWVTLLVELGCCWETSTPFCPFLKGVVA